jgi:hypothetical protein
MKGKKLPRLRIVIPRGLLSSRWSTSLTKSKESEGAVEREKRSIGVGEVDGA